MNISVDLNGEIDKPRLYLMLFPLLTCILVAMTSIGCAVNDHAPHQTDERIKHVKSTSIWCLRIGTDTLARDPSGAMLFLGILLHKGEVIFADPVQAKLNSLDIRTGRVWLGCPGTISNTTDSTGKYIPDEIEDYVWFSDHVVVLVSCGAYIIDSTLCKSTFNQMRPCAGLSTIHEVTFDSLVLQGEYTISGTTQANDRTYLTYITYDKTLAISQYQEAASTETMSSAYDNDRVGKLRGKPFAFKDIQGHKELLIGGSTYELPPAYEEHLRWTNMDFDDNRLVFWDLDEKGETYTITLLQY